ncbi:MAG TPA: TonB-dependent receptor [Microscillaceae bacterium]|nr:TonB-dependent receptor [Microscillaceae bacterium]
MANNFHLILFFFTTFLLRTTILAYAQGSTGGIEGYVKTTDGIPASFVNIILKGSTWGTITNEEGYYRFTEIPEGVYTLQISGIGYQDTEKPVRVLAGNTLQIAPFSLEEITEELQEVVVSGSLREESRADSPIPIEIYGRRFFQRNPTACFFESLSLVNGLVPQYNCNVCATGDIHINGMDGPYTMVLIDGMPIVSGLATVYGLNGIPNSMIERVEVVKGPASTMYGSEAVGGLINITTRSPQKSPVFALDVFTTSWAEHNTDLSTKFKLGKISALVGLNYFDFRQRIDRNNDGFMDMPLQQRISLFQKYNFERAQGRTASIAARLFYEDRTGGQTTFQANTRGNDQIYGESIHTKRFELIGNYQLPISKEKVIFSGSYTAHYQDSYYGTTYYVGNQHIGFGQLFWDKKIGKRHQLLVGGALRYTWYLDNSPATRGFGADSALQKPAQTYLPGIFIQDEISIHEKHKLLLGYRYDYNSVHGGISSPRISYKWAFNPRNIFRLSAGNGFRVVNLFTEEHAALTGARQVVIRERLNPETSWNVTLNFQKNIQWAGGNLALETGAFYTYFTNKIVGDFMSNPQQIIYDNLQGYAVSRGFSAKADLDLDNGLSIALSGTWMDVFQQEKDSTQAWQRLPQLHAPSFQGNFSVSYTVAKWGLTIDYNGLIYSPMQLPVLPDDFRPATSPWFTIQNIQFTKQFKKGFQLYGGVKNLFDFLPQNPLMRPFDPFDRLAFQADGSPTDTNPQGYTFDTAYNYAPMQGIRGFLGIRYTFK